MVGARLCSVQVGFVYSGYGCGSLAELTEVPGTGTCTDVLDSLTSPVGTRMLYTYPHPYPHPGIFARVYPYPGYCTTAVHNLQKFRVWVWKSCRTHRSSLYGCGSLTKITERPGRYTNVVPVTRVLCHGRSELTDVPGTRV